MTAPRWVAPGVGAGVVVLIVGGAAAVGLGRSNGNGDAVSASSATPVASLSHGYTMALPGPSSPAALPSIVVSATTKFSLYTSLPNASGTAANALPPASMPARPSLPAAADPVVARLSGWDDAPVSCVVLVRGVSPDEAVRRLGGDPAKHIPRYSDDPGVSKAATSVGVVSGWSVLDEDNGWSCSFPEPLAALTKGGATAVTAYWSETADTMLSLAIDGKVVTTWDLSDSSVDGTQPHRLDHLRARVAADVLAYHENSAMMAVAAGITGVELSADWKPRWTVWLPQD